MKYNIGDTIILKKPVEDGAWNSGMDQYVGQEDVIIFIGTYPGFGEYVQVGIDDKVFMWFEDMFELKALNYEIY